LAKYHLIEVIAVVTVNKYCMARLGFNQNILINQFQSKR